MHVLVVDDDPTIVSQLSELTVRESASISCAATLQQALNCIKERRPDILFLELMLLGGDAANLFQTDSATEVVLMTQDVSIDMSAQVHRFGAVGYLFKPIDALQFRSFLVDVAPQVNVKKDVKTLRDDTRLRSFGALYGSSKAMHSLYRQIERVAPTEATVFITGESGTGKELVAQTLHALSRRHTQPLIAVNCGAISPQLIESELFGHEKGSFTGALRGHKGHFERASGGTLFLDEIAEMPMESQVKLLRVLEAGTLMRVGSGHEIAVNVRVIAATNRIPEEAVADSRLREDLLYRLQVFPLRLPPLRERARDIELLANEFLDEINRNEHSGKLFSPDAVDALLKYQWPGNVRELKNVVQRAYILSDDVIDVHSLRLHVDKACGGNNVNGNANGAFQVKVGSTVAEVERSLILATMAHCGGTKERAAEMLGISLKTLYNRFREYDADNGIEKR